MYIFFNSVRCEKSKCPPLRQARQSRMNAVVIFLILLETNLISRTLVIIVLTGHVLRRLDLSNMTHNRPLVRGDNDTR